MACTVHHWGRKIPSRTDSQFLCCFPKATPNLEDIHGIRGPKLPPDLARRSPLDTVYKMLCPPVFCKTLEGKQRKGLQEIRCSREGNDSRCLRHCLQMTASSVHTHGKWRRWQPQPARRKSLLGTVHTALSRPWICKIRECKLHTDLHPLLRSQDYISTVLCRWIRRRRSKSFEHMVCKSA